MIQRIQTVFLALAAGADLSIFGFPFAVSSSQIEGSALFANDSLYNWQDNISLPIVFGIAGALALVAIFLFNDRKKQMLVTRIAVVASIIAVVLMVVFLWRDYQTMSSSVTLDDGIAAYTPIAGVIFLILAHRFINKDEKLVRSSYDRLR